MDKEIKRIVGAIILVPILIATFIFVEMLTYKKIDASKIIYESSSVETDSKDTTFLLNSLKQRGYVPYGNMAEQLNELNDKNIFAGDDEQKTTIKQIMDSFIDPEYLDNHNEMLPTEDGLSFVSCKLTFDENNNRFSEEAVQKIKQIEKCGFTGFTELMSKFEQSEKMNLGEKDSTLIYQPTHIYCNGVDFVAVKDDEGDYSLDLYQNASSFYVPQMYKGKVEQIVQNFPYRLFSSCVSGDKHVLTFCRDNSMSLYEGDSKYQKLGIAQNKMISFVYKDGKVVDYFVSMQSLNLNLNSQDEEFIKTQTAGLDLKLTNKPQDSDDYSGSWHVYTTD